MRLARRLDADPPEACAPGRRDANGSSRPRPLDPVELEQALRQRSAECAGDVIPALAPVEAEAGERPPGAARPLDVHSERVEAVETVGGQLEVAAARDERAAFEQDVQERHAE